MDNAKEHNGAVWWMVCCLLLGVLLHLIQWIQARCLSALHHVQHSHPSALIVWPRLAFLPLHVVCLCAVYADGRVCISILHAPGDDPMGYESSSERWSPVQSVEKILLSVVSMLAGMSPTRLYFGMYMVPQRTIPCWIFLGRSYLYLWKRHLLGLKCAQKPLANDTGTKVIISCS